MYVKYVEYKIINLIYHYPNKVPIGNSNLIWAKFYQLVIRIYDFWQPWF